MAVSLADYIVSAFADAGADLDTIDYTLTAATSQLDVRSRLRAFLWTVSFRATLAQFARKRFIDPGDPQLPTVDLTPRFTDNDPGDVIVEKLRAPFTTDGDGVITIPTTNYCQIGSDFVAVFVVPAARTITSVQAVLDPGGGGSAHIFPLSAQSSAHNASNEYIYICRTETPADSPGTVLLTATFNVPTSGIVALYRIRGAVALTLSSASTTSTVAFDATEGGTFAVLIAGLRRAADTPQQDFTPLVPLTENLDGPAAAPLHLATAWASVVGDASDLYTVTDHTWVSGRAMIGAIAQLSS